MLSGLYRPSRSTWILDSLQRLQREGSTQMTDVKPSPEAASRPPARAATSPSMARSRRPCRTVVDWSVTGHASLATEDERCLSSYPSRERCKKINDPKQG